MDIDALRLRVAEGDFAIRSHAMQHAVKEGFTQEDMIQVVLQGAVVETYPERERCLLYADIFIEGHRMPLHVVCEHRKAEAPVDLVTAYIPSEEEWETPSRRRKRK